MVVYVLIHTVAYEGDYVMAVYTDYNMAMDVMGKLNMDFPSNNYRLNDYDADSWTYDGVYE